MLIEVPIEGPFPDCVDFFNEKGQLIRQQVQFEWKPTKCTHCHLLGHTNDVCKKKKEIRMEWMPKEKEAPPTQKDHPTSPHLEASEKEAPLPVQSGQGQVTQNKEREAMNAPSRSSSSQWTRCQASGVPPASTVIQTVHLNPFQVLGNMDVAVPESPDPHGQHR